MVALEKVPAALVAALSILAVGCATNRDFDAASINQSPAQAMGAPPTILDSSQSGFDSLEDTIGFASAKVAQMPIPLAGITEESILEHQPTTDYDSAPDPVFAATEKKQEDKISFTRRFQGSLCNLGNADACAKLGDMMQKGEGGPLDETGARAAYEKACAKNHNRACYSAGVMQYFGYGGEANKERARASLKKSCGEKFKESCFLYGRMLQDGEGGEKDWVGARRAFDLACSEEEPGDPDSAGAACYTLGMIQRAGYGGPRDDARAVGSMKRSCRFGAGAGCYSLGVMLANGEGAERDPVGARNAFDKACAAGYGNACFQVGEMRFKGEGGAVDLAGARAAYKEGCDRDDARSCYQFGVMLSKGLGGDRDDVTARAVLGKACADQDMRSCEYMGYLLKNGYGGPIDLKAARAYYHRACDANLGFSCNELGIMSVHGLGGAKDNVAARRYYEKACAAGSEYGCYNAASMQQNGIGGPVDVNRARSSYKISCEKSYQPACDRLKSMDEAAKAAALRWPDLLYGTWEGISCKQPAKLIFYKGEEVVSRSYPTGETNMLGTPIYRTEVSRYPAIIARSKSTAYGRTRIRESILSTNPPKNKADTGGFILYYDPAKQELAGTFRTQPFASVSCYDPVFRKTGTSLDPELSNLNSYGNYGWRQPW